VVANHPSNERHRASHWQAKLAAKKRWKCRFCRAILPFATKTSLMQADCVLGVASATGAALRASSVSANGGTSDPDQQTSWHGRQDDDASEVS
jgi:hypothetical protein